MDRSQQAVALVVNMPPVSICDPSALLTSRPGPKSHRHRPAPFAPNRLAPCLLPRDAIRDRNPMPGSKRAGGSGLRRAILLRSGLGADIEHERPVVRVLDQDGTNLTPATRRDPACCLARTAFTPKLSIWAALARYYIVEENPLAINADREGFQLFPACSQ